MGSRKPDWVRIVSDRLRTESGSALLLLGVSLAALLWANSPWSESYTALWETHAVVGVGGFGIDLSLHEWVNDGLMVVFFFLIGLEVREDFAVGALRDRRRALVPLVAGVLGVVLPALIYLLVAVARRRRAGARSSAPTRRSSWGRWRSWGRACRTSCASSC